MNKTIYVIGHRNPDTDAIVAATAYARLQNLLGHNEYVAARAGHLTPQTEYIYNRFNMEKPVYFHDMLPKVAFYMKDRVETVSDDTSLWAAVNLMEKTNDKVLAVVDHSGCYKALLHYNAFACNILGKMNPEKKMAVSTSIALIRDTLGAQPLFETKTQDIFKGTILCAVNNFESFKKHLDEHASENVIVITGDRDDVQQYCVEKGVKAIVLTSGFLPKKELTASAASKGINVLSSPFDTSSTATLIMYSTPVSVMADSSILPVRPSDYVQKIKQPLRQSPSRSLPVIDENDKLIGIINENDLLQEANAELVLVDHNERTQAVEGSENYIIRTIIDHHRIGGVVTRYPITFVNKPVGSTSTLVAGLYRENHVSIPVDIAQILLCGILSDTLILQSATVTDIDRETAEYLSNIANIDIQELGHDILSAGSRVENRTAAQIIKQDMKEYTEGKITYTVSQVEVEGSREIMERKDEFLKELEFERRSHKALFSVLLITDIGKLNSEMLIDCNKAFLPFITFQKIDDNTYFLKDVVSRKKQLIPMLTEQLSKYGA
ncbi:MAG: putative manganese-dependent inorganic diphosphatase [Treponema sp.]|nr:putative manganese-dependent inorganic diphosphatase [Treponema sp.]